MDSSLIPAGGKAELLLFLIKGLCAKPAIEAPITFQARSSLSRRLGLPRFLVLFWVHVTDIQVRKRFSRVGPVPGIVQELLFSRSG